ncbi:hypothetical protein [Flavobacterium muglaense]|uniref:Uncharacterized protein n=1 Tax=Flavobacterium muglaense TaxID=2764716 RepID=A0A923SFR4_9FLAO|nr:hypothetical protein [Flavobacterium muglaense]MBC5837476.1 hypothetical protein [Flavobacterium muglaense]MBC5844004.1 hypothetical protein [Flavobacterium muglaense]
MKKQFHIIPKDNTDRYEYDAVNNNLVLQTAGKFSVSIKELDELLKNKPAKPKQFQQPTDSEFANLTAREKIDYNVKAKKHSKEVEDYDSFQEKIAPYQNLNWAWAVIGHKLDPNIVNHNKSFAKGIQEIEKHGHIQFPFPKLLEGGGLCWLEAWPDGEKPRAKLGSGLFVQAKGAPSIIKTVWTDFDYNPLDGVKIAFMSEVILHVYTTGMYGHDIEVHLIDRDIFDPNDELEIKDKKSFTRQIGIAKVEEKFLDKKITIDTLVESSATDANNQVESEEYVQKIAIQVLIDSNWKEKHGEHLEIFPAIKSIKTGTYFKGFTRNRLNVSTDKDSEVRQVVAVITNNPVLVGTVETNVADFLPCRFDSIKLDDKEIFNSTNVYHRNKKTIDIEVIAGKKESHTLDFDFQTLECDHKPNKHTNKELSILVIPENFKLKKGTGIAPEQPVKESYIATTVTSTKNLKYAGGANTTVKGDNKIDEGIVTVQQKQIQFDAFFNYNVEINSYTRFFDIAKYFWLGDSFTNGSEILKIKALAQTCAFDNMPINIAIYPDIKWSILFGFNVDSEQLKSLRPSWDQDKAIKRFQWDEDKFIAKQEAKIEAATTEAEKQKIKDELKDRERTKELNKETSKLFVQGAKDHYGVKDEVKKKKEAKPEKGKLSTLLDIMKEVEISVKAEIYGGTELELTSDFIKNNIELEKQYGDIRKQLKWVVDLIKGKNDTPTNQADGDTQIKQLIDNRKKTKIKGLEKALERSTQEVEIIYPKFSLGGNWQFEQVDAAKYPALAGRSGFGYQFAFVAAPLIGIDIRWHILDLLCRKHPIAYAVLAAVKTLMAALGDNPDGVKVDLWVKGQISTDIKYEGNQLAGSQEASIKGDAHITAGVDISIKIEGIKTSGKFTAVAEVGIGASGEVGFGITTTLGVDDQGVWSQSSLIFDGLKITFTAVIAGKVTKERVNKDGITEEVEIVGGESKVEVTITMGEDSLESDKYYFK